MQWIEVVAVHRYVLLNREAIGRRPQINHLAHRIGMRKEHVQRVLVIYHWCVCFLFSALTSKLSYVAIVTSMLAFSGSPLMLQASQFAVTHIA